MLASQYRKISAMAIGVASGSACAHAHDYIYTRPAREKESFWRGELKAPFLLPEPTDCSEVLQPQRLQPAA